MINYLHKPKDSRIWRWRFRLRREDRRITDVSLGVTDMQSAQKKRTELLRELEHERAGIIPPKAAREAAQRKLTEHLDEFVAELRRCGKSEKHLANIEYRVGRLIKECGWIVAKDVTSDSFQAWRQGMRNLSDKTVNDYLEAVRSLFNWMVKVDRAGSNPLVGVEKVKTKEGRPKERCAMTIEQVVCLLLAAGERWPVYLMALQTGLRRSELAALQWSDLRLDEEKPFVSVRASTTKNGKAAAI